MRVKLAASHFIAITLFSFSASSHNVWCHCADKDQIKTVEFFHYAGAVYEAFSDSVRIWHDANTPLEEGVLAEFEHHAGIGTALRPELYRESLLQLRKLDRQFDILRSRLVLMDEFVATMDIIDGYDEAVTKILAESTGIPRLSKVGVRYSDVGGMNAEGIRPMIGVRGIIRAQIEDLVILQDVLSEVIEGLRDAMPLAERGEFASVMLSGRNTFGDRNPQFTDLFNAYERLYVQSCMATIAATMQIYPVGFEWLP